MIRRRSLPADVTDAEAMEAAFADFIESAGRLDVLFNNAGMFGPRAPSTRSRSRRGDEVLDVNLTGMFLCARAGLSRRCGGNRRRAGGSSTTARSRPMCPAKGSVCYTTTKHAITGLTRTLSLDGRPFDIACGQIDIGNAETELVADLRPRQASGGEEQATMDVADAAAAVLHMAKMPLRGQCAVHDRDGDENALYRARLR
jgi:NAD(P)-dependent dehydrogenase (short-subunit alcohol dehydrogenase family)